MSSGRIGIGTGARLRNNEPRLSDAQPFAPDADYVRKGAYFQSLTGVAITRMGNGDWFWAVDTTAGNVTVTLPLVADEVGHHHFVKRVSGGSNECNIVAADGTAILDGSATHSIAAQYGVRSYFSDGTAWRSTGAATGRTGEIASGIYTPTLTGVANVSATTAYQCQFMRVLDVASVSGRMDVTPTAGLTFTQVGISLPIASSIAGFETVGGTAVALGNPSTRGGIGGDAANARAELRFVSDSTALAAFAFSFQYRII